MFEHLLPRGFSNPQETVESLELHQMAQEFHLEVEYREQFDAYCEWYYRVAREHQEDHARMRLEPNLLSWFNRGIPSDG
jgi:hypothetical protein